MDGAQGQPNANANTTLIRLGGGAGFLVFGLHILINSVLIEPLPASGEFETYLGGTLGATAIGHGLRYLAFFVLAFFAVGMYLLSGGGKASGWAILGLLGGALQFAIAVVANTFQTAAVLYSADLADRPDQVTLLWNLGRALFRVEPTFAGLMFLGFTIAGWRSRTIPRWMAIPALLMVAVNLVVAVLLAWVLTHDSAEILLWARTVLGMIWFISACFLLVRFSPRR